MQHTDLGPVSDALLHHTQCAVAVIPGGERLAQSGLRRLGDPAGVIDTEARREQAPPGLQC